MSDSAKIAQCHSSSANIAKRLSEMAQRFPDQIAISEPNGNNSDGSGRYRSVTFRKLDETTDRIASGLIECGLRPGMKLVLFVPFSIDFVTLTFALFKAGAVIVLIDPGMGKTNIFQCLEEVNADGFVAVPVVHLVRALNRKRFPNARFNVSSRFWMPGVKATLRQLSKSETSEFQACDSKPDDLAAIIFTSGSTGPPKGVAYEHGMFDAQVRMIQQHYGIQSGEVDLPGFPLFGLFNAAMGVTTVIPDMDPTNPAQVDPKKIIRAIEEKNVTQAFGSPAFWNRVGRYCEEHNVTFPNLNRALSAGGPVPVHVLKRMQQVLTKPDADLYTPYGATESLPVASIGGKQVLSETSEATSRGAGTCVGPCFDGVDVKIIEITDGPIESIDQANELPVGEIGEIIVCSPSVTREYFQRPEATRAAKIPDSDRFWHRIGDVGYFDDQNRLWFCGRKAHIVPWNGEQLFSVRCEAIFNEHPNVYRSALVAIGADSHPAIVVEPEAGQFPETIEKENEFRQQLLKLTSENELTMSIKDVLFYRSLPVDTRHNVKINREALAEWATKELTR